MPLMKKRSNKAFEHNIKAEMHAGKPQPQALAIAYSVKRKAKKASGGMVRSGSRDMDMAKGGNLDTNAREHIAAKNFAGPDRSYPIEDAKHARNALARVSQHGSPALQEKVRNKVHKKYPGIDMKAEGGSISAANEKRPMPDNRYDDSRMISQNSSRKSNGEDGWLDQPTVRQAQKNNGREVLPIKRPKMVPSDAFSTRLYDEEGRLQESDSPGPYGSRPPEHDNEEGPDRQGPRVSDMEDEHSTHRKPYADGGYIPNSNDLYNQKATMESLRQAQQPELRREKQMTDEDNYNRRATEYKAKGGQIERGDSESHNINHPTDMEPDENDMYNDPMGMDEPSEDEGSSLAHSRNEMDADSHGDEVPDMEDEHSTGRKPYAGGGRIGDDDWDHEEEMNPAHDRHSRDDSEDQPEHEEGEEHHNSIAAAIMAKREHNPAEMSDSDMDEMMRLYEGGEIMEKADRIHSHGSFDTHEDDDQADLSRNADEDANEEDQMSWNALRKENYSESDGLKELDNPEDSAEHGDDEEMDSHDRHDMISSIRRRMKNR